MPIQPVLTLGGLKTLVTAHLSHTRPVSTAELNEAINFGYGKVLRAIRSVRPQPTLSYVDPFTLSPNVTEYDVSTYTPPLIRPVRLIAGGPTRNTRPILFRPRAMMSEEYQQAELSTAGSFSTLLYDLIEGMFPKSALTSVGAWTASSVQLSPALTVNHPVRGDLILVQGFGAPATPPDGVTGIVQDHYAIVVATSTPANYLVAFSPAIPASAGVPSVGQQVLVLRRRLLMVAPTLKETVTGRLWYQYIPNILTSDGDFVDPLVAQNRDCVVYYALSALRLAVGDVDTDRWLSRAEALRSEMMQDMEPGSWQGTEALGSALDGIGDY